MERWASLAELAASQFGLIAVWQAGEFGISRQLLSVRAKEEGWHRPLRGVYLLPAHSLTPLARVKATELALRVRGLASHQTAAFVWGLSSRVGRRLEFIVPPASSLCVQGARLRRRDLRWTDGAARKRGIWTIAPAPTICSLAETSTVPQLTSTIATAHRLRLAAPSGIDAVATTLQRFPGCARLRAALADLARQGLSHSSWERLARRVLDGGGFTPHPTPHTVEDGSGLVAELDIAFPEWKVGIPVDGPHHLDPNQKRADDDQRLRLQLLGWLLVPTDEARLRDQPKVFLRQVESALRKQGWSR
ncbi:MAG: hypothetical protein ACRDU8_07530 [Egibacteraceae bacterium]